MIQVFFLKEVAARAHAKNGFLVAPFVINSIKKITNELHHSTSYNRELALNILPTNVYI
jgi:hypothetical protein